MAFTLQVYSLLYIYFLLYVLFGILPSYKQLTEAIIGTEKAIQG